jgi:hypothetical protein
VRLVAGLQQGRGLRGGIGENGIGAGTLEGQEALQDDAVVVQPAVRRRRLSR